MNITFMIGNGLDISVGLKTSYRDFYEYIKNNLSYDEKNRNDILVNIDENIELWSDLELGLGDYTHNIGDDESKLEKFYKDKFEIDLKLREYLRREQDKINWHDEGNGPQFKTKFVNHIVGFYNFLKPSDKDEILKLIDGNSLKYNLISFNYTEVIKDGININRSSVIEALYLHGTLAENNSILGVNDFEQIKNKNFNKRDEMLLSMCKLEINKFIGEYRATKAEGILNFSDIVCIFGMSIGKTDKFWWEKLMGKFSVGVIRSIIVFHYVPNLDIRNNVELWREQERVKQNLLNYLLIDINKDMNDMKDMKDRIKVICNSDMFNIKLKLNEESDFDINVKEKVAVTQ